MRTIRPHITWRRLAALAGVALVYAALYRLVVASSSFSASAGTPFWPPAGFTLALLLLRPRREWPGYLVAIFATETALDWDADFGLWVSPVMGLANTAEPLLAALLLRRWLSGRVPDLSVLRDLGLFVLAGAVAGPMLGAAIGSVGPWLLASDPVWPRLPRWYVGDALGVIALAPVILFVARAPFRRPRLEHAWPVALLAVTAVLALGPWEFAGRIGLPFLVIPALGVVAMRIGTGAVTVGIFAVAVLVETTTAVGAGAFAVHGPFDGLVVAQLYLATCALSGLGIAALMAGFVSRGEMALHDALTGLPNRRLLFDRIALACRQLDRRPGYVGLLFIDLDGFKAANDSYGHDGGDQVLTTTAERLRATVRDEDTVARLGGDEFVVLVSHVKDPLALPELAERIAAVLAAPIAVGRSEVAVTASVGIAATSQADELPEVLLTEADHAMYAQKRAHRESAQAPYAPA